MINVTYNYNYQVIACVYTVLLQHDPLSPHEYIAMIMRLLPSFWRRFFLALFLVPIITRNLLIHINTHNVILAV